MEKLLIENIRAGVTQVSISGPLFFFKYINDLTTDLKSNVKFVVEKLQTQKHLGLKLDTKLCLKEHLKDKFAKVNRGIGILKKLSGCLHVIH